MGTMTIKDIAKKCKVGVSTVSRAMNNHPDINPETKEMIMRVIEESNYVPNNSARNLKRADAKAIAVLIKGIGNTFFNQLINVLERECQEKKYSCILQRVEEGENELEVPYVLSTIYTTEEQKSICASVSVDDFRESYKMTEYLIGLGHKRIAIITARKEDESIGKLRLLGYRKALEDHGIPFDENLVCYMELNVDQYSFKSGYKITKKLLKRNVPFTALYATSDTLAIGACRALKEAGIRVPEDCSVAGFDGMDAGEFYIPSITTIRQPVEEIAQASAKLLFDMIKKKEQPKRMIFEGELMVRESTGAPGKG